MELILEKLKKYNLDDAIQQEQNDPQFIALKNLFLNMANREVFLFLVLANSLVCYQLSGKGEDYWEEFSNFFIKKSDFTQNDIISNLVSFIKSSKNNRRLVGIKIKRLEKLKNFISLFDSKKLFYYENMNVLRNDLSSLMGQKKDAKTIVFAVKMFSYAARLYFGKLIFFPFDIEIPIDSRLENIYAKYNSQKDLSIKTFYKNISEKLDIPELHLDAIIWCNYENLK